MKRRDFLKFIVFSPVASVLFSPDEAFSYLFPEEISEQIVDQCKLEDGQKIYNKEYFKKIEEFNHSFDDDVHATAIEFALIKSCNLKLRELMRFVGFGNFNVITYKDSLSTMSMRSTLQEFTPQEKSFLEDFFSRSASYYGFYGDKVCTSLHDEVNAKQITKMPYTGHYLYKGRAEEVYKKITSEMDTLILTSGVRGVVKQAGLFLNKIVDTNGNISMASRSIAPIGYSFHGIGDFDVGIKGWGHNNFTEKFATTQEYSKLMEGGYMRIRYDRKNPYGVRFEPWHVKVV